MTDQLLAALGGLHDHGHRHSELLEQLLASVRARHIPPQLKILELTAGRPLIRDEERDSALSLTVINPAAARLLIGVQGGSAAPGARGIPVPPKAMMVLPIAVADLELGADTTDATTAATLAAGAIAVYVLRHPTVQPAHLFALA